MENSLYNQYLISKIKGDLCPTCKVHSDSCKKTPEQLVFCWTIKPKDIYNREKNNYIRKSLCATCPFKILRQTNGKCRMTSEQINICLSQMLEYKSRLSGSGGVSNNSFIELPDDVKGVNLELDINDKIEKVNVSLFDIKRLFVNRYDTYSLQNPKEPGKFPDTKAALTDDIILQSLLGSITIGVRSVNPETNMVKWIAWDIDANENDNPVDVVKSMLKILKEQYKLTGYVEASGSKDSYHVWIFIEPTINDEKLLKWDEELKRKVGTVNEGAFMDRGICIGEKKEGCMIKLPFTIQRKNNVRSKFLNVMDISKIVPQKLNLEA